MMPTGYTATLHDGEQVFEDFVLQCARAFGALVMMRDSPLDVPIPETLTFEDSYYERSLGKAKSELKRLQTMSKEEAENEAVWSWQAAVESWEERKAITAERQRRYEDMLAQVRAWDPPSPDHEPLKKFMIEQLEGSIEFDCSMKYDDRPTPSTGTQWLAKALAKAERDIVYYSEELKEETARENDRQRWIDQLRGSLEVKV